MREMRKESVHVFVCLPGGMANVTWLIFQFIVPLSSDLFLWPYGS